MNGPWHRAKSIFIRATRAGGVSLAVLPRKKTASVVARPRSIRIDLIARTTNHAATSSAEIKPMTPEISELVLLQRLRAAERGGLREEAYTTLCGDAADALTRSSEQAAQGWQPIETAPRDGRMALVYRPLALKSGDEPVAVKRLVKGNQFCWDSTVPPGAKPFNPTDGACHVTHWMPIPEPPSAAVVSGSTEGGNG